MHSEQLKEQRSWIEDCNASSTTNIERKNVFTENSIKKVEISLVATIMSNSLYSN